MEKLYLYGPLKTSYFSQFEKMWIEGYCKERKLNLCESNLDEILTEIAKENKGPKDLISKIEKLLIESVQFSNFIKSSITKTWDKLLGFAMGKVIPQSGLNENQIIGIKKSCLFWLKEAPKTISNNISNKYYKEIILECVSNDVKILDELKNFDFKKTFKIAESIKKDNTLYGVLNEMNKKLPVCKFPTKEILKHESILNIIPNPETFCQMISWTVECVKLSN